MKRGGHSRNQHHRGNRVVKVHRSSLGSGGVSTHTLQRLELHQRTPNQHQNNNLIGLLNQQKAASKTLTISPTITPQHHQQGRANKVSKRLKNYEKDLVQSKQILQMNENSTVIDKMQRQRLQQRTEVSGATTALCNKSNREICHSSSDLIMDSPNAMTRNHINNGGKGGQVRRKNSAVG